MIKMALIIDGKKIASDIRCEQKERVSQLRSEGITPGLAVILVGNNEASKIYVRNKRRACEDTGIYSEQHLLPESTSEEELVSLIEKLNCRDDIDGILVQLPLPKGIDEKKIIETISKDKDVDGFHPYNTGSMLCGTDCFLPCTPAGIIELLSRSDIEISGKNCTVIGRSNIVGKPAAIMMLAHGATVTICHTRTKDLAACCRSADIIIAAAGRPGLVTADMVKDGAVIIDAGINRDGNGRLCGDVDYDAVLPKVSAITPVPGGVGPMTIAMLMVNTVKSAEKRLAGH